MWRRFSLCVASVLGVAVLAGCSGKDPGSLLGTTVRTNDENGGGEAVVGDSGANSIDLESMTAAADLTDAEVLQVLIDASGGNTGLGILASQGAKNPAVRTFATEMASEHMTNVKQTTVFAGTLGIPPEDSAVSERVRLDAQTSQARLGSTPAGPEFDRLYLQAFSKERAEFLGCLDRMLDGVDSPDLLLYVQARRDEASGDLRAGTSLLMQLTR